MSRVAQMTRCILSRHRQRKTVRFPIMFQYMFHVEMIYFPKFNFVGLYTCVCANVHLCVGAHVIFLIKKINHNNFVFLRCMYLITNREREREMFYLTTHSTHFIYGYMVSDIWLRTILIVRKETRCHYIGYSYQLIARVLLYAPSHRQYNTYHGLCYTSHGALAGMRNSSTG